MLPMINSAMPRCSSVKSVSRTWSINIWAKEVPAASESNMNWRFSSSSADWRMGMFVCEKWSRHSWSSCTSFSNSA